MGRNCHRIRLSSFFMSVIRLQTRKIWHVYSVTIVTCRFDKHVFSIEIAWFSGKSSKPARDRCAVGHNSEVGVMEPSEKIYKVVIFVVVENRVLGIEVAKCHVMNALYFPGVCSLIAALTKIWYIYVVTSVTWALENVYSCWKYELPNYDIVR